MTALETSKELAAKLVVFNAKNKWNGKVYNNQIFVNGETVEVVENFLALYNKAQVVSTDAHAFDLLFDDKNEELFQYVVSNL